MRLRATCALAPLVLVLPITVAAQTTRPASPQKTGEITGVVNFCVGGTSGVLVHIPGESFQARVAPSGRFVLRFVPVGTYSLIVEAPDRQPYQIQHVLVADNRVTDLDSISICRDNDGDGFNETVDCNDNNPAVHPNAAEQCDGSDNNCNGTVDEGCALCTDADGDGFYAQAGCGTSVDCNDTNRLISPVAPEACDGVDNNCNGAVDETYDLSSDASNCGICGGVCSFANAVGACAGGACVMAACAPGFADCDGNPVNGCESSMASSASCGACGVVCGEGSTCAGGACVPAACEPGFGNCDGSVLNGCETPLNTLSSCGACGVTCFRPNASTTCSSGTCGIVSCNAGFANCDFSDVNGCETVLSGASNSPSAPEFLGSWDADSTGGFLCTSSRPCEFATSRNGTSGRHYEVVARESEACLASLKLRITLTVPAGTAYGLHASGTGFTCLNSAGQASCEDIGPGTRSLTLVASDTAADDSFIARIEVRYAGGSSCVPWTLNVQRGGC